MGVIQGAINQTLGTAAVAAAIGNSISQAAAPGYAEEQIPGVEKEIQEATQKSLELGEKEYFTRVGAEDAYLSDKGVDTTDENARKEGLAGLSEEESEQLYARSKAVKAQQDAQEALVVQRQAIKQYLEDVASGKIKTTKRDVRKKVGGKK